MIRPDFRFLLLGVLCVCAPTAAYETSGAADLPADAGTFLLVCPRDNDLLRVLASNNVPCCRHDSAEEAIRGAADGDAVLVLADAYPEKPTAIGAEVYDRAAEKKVRLYVEYPAFLPGVRIGQARASHVERIVVTSDFFGDELKPMRLAAVNGLRYLPIEAERTHLVAARVAGFDKAVYGLPDATSPILFELPGRDVLVGTTNLSRFVTGRYAPQDSWREIWAGILRWLRPDVKHPPLRWTPQVGPTYARDEKLPEDFELDAIRRGLAWYDKSKMIEHPDWEERLKGVQRLDGPPADMPPGDGSVGCFEAVLSVLHEDGSQSISTVRRGDCVCESAMALALTGKLLKKPERITVADRMLDYWLFDSDACKRERGDPEHGAYGLIAWGVTTPAWYRANYGDDNARVMLGTLAGAAVSGEDRWDETMMKCLLANLRTTGQLGFRGSRIDVPGLADWRPYFRRRTVNLSAHFEAYLWACYLWAYEQTGEELFLDRAETALRMMMDGYTDDWQWCNGLAQERARILLPLAWLVRAKDTPETRAMLRKGVDGLLSLQQPCGAIREELGLPGRGKYPPPRSNAAYGTNEASLIAKNGDPVSDLLYTTNFAMLGLHEAAAVLDDPEVDAACDRLAEFLCRIQVRSDAQPSVDGGWFRAFDFGRWEHWGCNADHGWGAWSIESGWTQGWILAVLSMRQMDTSLWELTHDSRIERTFDRLRKQMLPEDAIEGLKPRKLEHAAIGKPVVLTIPADPRYPARGAASLTDGLTSPPDHTTGYWLGFHGKDLEATVDLGAEQSISRIAARFLQSKRVGVHLPAEVEFAVSTDGKRFRPLVDAIAKDKKKDNTDRIATVAAEKLDVRARHVRVRAKNVAVIPPGEHAAGLTAWLFIDEIVIEE